MRCFALIPLLAVGLVAWSSCQADEPGLSGSQCDLIDCGYEELYCQKDTVPNDNIKMFYRRAVQEGYVYAAILTIDLVGVERVEGLRVEGEEFVNRVGIYRPGTEQWPDVLDGQLTIDQGGDEVERPLRGKASFRFKNGYLATARFDCVLHAVVIE